MAGSQKVARGASTVDGEQMQMKKKREDIVKADYEIGGQLTRTIVIAASDGRGRVVVTELENDVNVVTIVGGEPAFGPDGTVAVTLDAQRLWHLIHGVAELFGGTVLEPDKARLTQQELIDKVRDVLCANEARCLDDDIDREVVLRELVRALCP